jgi:hypothetical protein
VIKGFDKPNFNGIDLINLPFNSSLFFFPSSIFKVFFKPNKSFNYSLWNVEIFILIPA